MVCACTIQQLDEKSTERIEHSLGETTDQLSEKYHNAARELGSAIPLGRYHIHNVLWQLHSCYWFKAEAKFLEAWHVLGTAVREAQELGNDILLLDLARQPASACFSLANLPHRSASSISFKINESRSPRNQTASLVCARHLGLVRQC